MLDPETFLKNGGQRGPQLTVLQPGKYVLNDYLWDVEIADAQDVNTGFVGVVKSNVWATVNFGTLSADKPAGCDVIGARDRNEGRIEAPIVPVGCVGVWQAALQPGKYYIHPKAYTITPIDTRAQVWTYAGDYERCQIALNVDGKGEITQRRNCEKIAQSAENADRAVFVKMEGWDVPLELRVVAQVSPTEASCVVAGVGSLKEVEDRVLTPSIRAIVRDVAGGTYDVEEAKTDENGRPILENGRAVMQRVKRPTKVLDLINQRPLIEGEVERRIRPEAEKSCVTIREVRLGEPAIPPELLVAVRREQLATQLQKAYVQEQQAQDMLMLSRSQQFCLLTAHTRNEAPRQGRPLGVRNRLSRKFLDDALASWEEHGPAALKQMRWRDPVSYCRVMAAIVPKELQIDVTRSALSPEDREALIEFYRQYLLKIEKQDEAQKQLLIESKVEDGCVAN